MELLAQGREAEVFAWGDGTVLKLFREGDAERARIEATALAAVAASGVAAPQAMEVVEVDGRHGIVLERVAGPDLLTILERKPYLVLAVARALASVHIAMHDVVAPASLPSLHDELALRIESASALDADRRRFALDALASLPRGDRLCHGDLHPGNLLGDVGRPVAIDGGDAARGDPVADVARTELLVRFGHLPPGTPWALRRVAAVGRGLLVRRYLRSYRRQRSVDADLLRRWRPVRAAARLGEGVDDAEVPALLALVRRF